MKLFKPKFWDKNNISFFSLILYPFTFLLDLNEIISSFFISKKKFSKIKTICVGNIYLGGTGKTPLAGYLTEYINKKLKTVIIKKKYKKHIDEKILLEVNNKVLFEKDRLKSVKIAIKKKFKVAVFDDGLQDRNIDYDLKIVCFNGNNLIGNNLRLPAGPLREKIDSLKNYHAVFINGENSNRIQKFSKTVKIINPKIEIFYSEYRPENLKSILKSKYIVFSGIGNPQSFYNTLIKFHINFSKKLVYPDHYNYTHKDIKEIKLKAKRNNLKILTTEKDYYRISKNLRKNINFLKIKLKVKKDDKFKKFVNKFL